MNIPLSVWSVHLILDNDFEKNRFALQNIFVNAITLEMAQYHSESYTVCNIHAVAPKILKEDHLTHVIDALLRIGTIHMERKVKQICSSRVTSTKHSKHTSSTILATISTVDFDGIPTVSCISNQVVWARKFTKFPSSSIVNIVHRYRNRWFTEGTFRCNL